MVQGVIFLALNATNPIALTRNGAEMLEFFSTFENNCHRGVVFRNSISNFSLLKIVLQPLLPRQGIDSKWRYYSRQK